MPVPDVELAPRPESHSVRPVVMSGRGLVVAGTPLAAQAGAEMLARGGNAVDAAIAAAAVQAVVMPHLSGFGGDMFLLFRRADGAVRALNASGPAPDGATPEAFAARGMTAVPLRGIEAASVPGAVEGWFRALRELGRLKPATVFERALEHAREGFPVHKNFVRYLLSPAFQGLRTTSPGLDALYFRGGRPPAVGVRLVQPEMAKMLERVVRDGPDEFYRGETAELVAEASAQRSGFLGRADLTRYESRWVNPLSVLYRGYTVYQIPPNSQGIAMLQQLRSLEQFDLQALGHNTPEYVHLLVEAKKAAFVDRARFVADPEVVPVPVDEMLSPGKAAAFRASFEPARASGARGSRVRRPAGDTTCLAVVDDDGNAVSLIQSLFDDFGCGVFVEKAGFALQNRMCGFTLEPGHPNLLTRRKRPMHTLCCSLVTQDERLFMTYATPGGHAQTQTLVQILNNVLVFDMDVQEAVEAPRFTHEGDRLLLESGLPATTRGTLEEYGHTVEFIPRYSSLVGGSAAIIVHPEGGMRLGGADPRRDSYAIPA